MLQKFIDDPAYFRRIKENGTRGKISPQSEHMEKRYKPRFSSSVPPFPFTVSLCVAPSVIV
jgi:hypothetical protein